MELLSVRIEKPEAINFILGQTHFIKTVEDLHEALVGAVPEISLGLAFCEASGKCLVRGSSNDPAMIELAKSNAPAIGASHSCSVCVPCSWLRSRATTGATDGHRGAQFLDALNRHLQSPENYDRHGDQGRNP